MRTRGGRLGRRRRRWARLLHRAAEEIKQGPAVPFDHRKDEPVNSDVRRCGSAYLPQFDEGKKMSTFQKTVFAVVLATAFAAVPATSHAFKICNPDGTNCFEFECLPSDKDVLHKVPEEDTQLCLKKGAFTADKGVFTAANRKEALKIVSDGCVSAGGVLADKGSKVTCTLRGPSPRADRTSMGANSTEKASLRNPKANCEAGGRVWEGADGKGSCTGPRTK